MESPTLQICILLFIFLGASILLLSLLKTKKILGLFKPGQELRRWRILFFFILFFLAGYSFVFSLLVAGLDQWIPLLTGTVFFFGALFIYLSVSIYHQTLRQLLGVQNQHRLAKETAEVALQELRHTQMQLVHDEKMLSLGQLVAGVAHEINNPVNFIYGNLAHADEYVQDLFRLLNHYNHYYPQPKPEIRDIIEEIDLEFLKLDLPRLLGSMQLGTERIREIVSSLRNFSRLDQAKLKLASLQEGIENTLMILRGRISQDSEFISLEIDKEFANLPLVECYPGELNQVFMNLLSNAIDAIEESFNSASARQETFAGMICIHTETQGQDWVRVRIRDNGAGMSEEVRSHIFDPFFTTKPIGKGTGLGLSMSHQIVVEKHQGRLYCLSTPGKGTEFVIELPVRLDSLRVEEEQQQEKITG